MSVSRILANLTEEQIINELNAARTFIVEDRKVKDMTIPQVLTFLKDIIIEKENYASVKIHSIKIDRHPEKFADVIIYTLEH